MSSPIASLSDFSDFVLKVCTHDDNCFPMLWGEEEEEEEEEEEAGGYRWMVMDFILPPPIYVT